MTKEDKIILNKKIRKATGKDKIFLICFRESQKQQEREDKKELKKALAFLEKVDEKIAKATENEKFFLTVAKNGYLEEVRIIKKRLEHSIYAEEED